MVLPYPGTDVPGTNARHSVGTIKGEGTDESEHEHQGLVGAMFERVVRSTILLSSVISIILQGVQPYGRSSTSPVRTDTSVIGKYQTRHRYK
jgi:hypothetical protein